MNPTETVLLYNFSGTDTGQKLKSVLLQMRVRIKLVEPDQYLEPIGWLAGIKAIPPTGEVYKGSGFPEQMLVMRGFTGNRIDELLQLLRRYEIPPILLKAVVTEHNKYWNSLELHEELQKEHAAMQARSEQSDGN
ncbi:DUF3783 domain-containing protein [Qiania dongpingensis]|uniref:DUF3783 domain-containing protein n=1 Tax=Qiania dongpingensis TaxID=2763669 RepID=A0A7G9G541_9FIRM|nr:DUF3783 domain-containing protein [Qiania dongpingensis]QNM05923.1 DUF3783 domain-containing protein [Qiania dongpingensis]